jgi:hypothetical protein
MRRGAWDDRVGVSGEADSLGSVRGQLYPRDSISQQPRTDAIQPHGSYHAAGAGSWARSDRAPPIHRLGGFQGWLGHGAEVPAGGRGPIDGRAQRLPEGRDQDHLWSESLGGHGPAIAGHNQRDADVEYRQRLGLCFGARQMIALAKVARWLRLPPLWVQILAVGTFMAYVEFLVRYWSH